MLSQKRGPKTRHKTESVLRRVLEGAKVVIDGPNSSETESSTNPKRFESEVVEHRRTLVLPKQKTEPPAALRIP